MQVLELDDDAFRNRMILAGARADHVQHLIDTGRVEKLRHSPSLYSGFVMGANASAEKLNNPLPFPENEDG